MSRLQCTPYPDYMAIESLFSEEQKLVIQSTRSFVKKELDPMVRDCFQKEEFPTHLIEKFGEVGVLGANIKGYGLPGLDAIAYGLIMKELERCDSGFRSFASVQGSLVMYPIYAYGSEEQKDYWLPQLGSGTAVGCFGLTESEGGSDPGAMKTHAELQGDQWVINGSKMWITNGNLAQIAVVWAQTNDGIRGFLIPTATKGFTAKKMVNKLSLRASITSELYFDKVQLPKSALLPQSNGLKSALSCLTQARYGIAWGALGAAEACFDEACRYVKNRVVFNKPLAAFQLVQKKLATACTKLTTGQLLALRLGQLKDENKLHFAQVSMAKQHNVELALDIARVCRDILGANGIMLEYETMRHMSNLETVYTYEGTNDIHSLIVGQQITGLPAFS